MKIFSRRRRAPVSDELWNWALREHPILRGFEGEEGMRLRELSENLLAKKQFLPVHGAQANEEMLLSIAAQASLPILHLGLDWYRDWGTLYLVPEEYEFEDTEVDEAGVVHEISDTVSGQTMRLGSVVLSVADVEASGWGDGYNVVIHEAAHILDRQSGSINGSPPLHRGMRQEAWTAAFSEAYGDLQAKVVESSSRRRGRSRRLRSVIDPYAAEAPEEFFAVTSELFFEQPWALQREYRAVYEQLALFYRQEPLDRLPGPPRRG